MVPRPERLCGKLGNTRGVAAALEGLAALATLEDEPERAARLLGAISALRVTLGEAAVLASRRQFEARVEAARARLGQDHFATLWEEGRAMAPDEAIACALDGSA